MRNEQWEAVYTVFEAMEGLWAGAKGPGSGSKPHFALRSLQEGQTESSKPPPFQMGKDALVHLRCEIRRQLDVLRIKLREQFSEFDCFLILFPIVAHFDELVQTGCLDVNEMSWPPLQQELFKIDKAGELFYETLDDILRKPQTPTFTFEVYYFCLCHGFRGKYESDTVKINEYMSILQQKIPVHDIAGEHDEREEGQVRIGPIGSAVWYYVAAAFCTVLAYGVFYVLANY